VGNNKKDSALGSREVMGADSTEALLKSLIISSDKVDASALHIYSNPKSKTCYFEVGGRLEPTGKKFGDKALEELLEFIKDSANLETSELNQAQAGRLVLQDITLPAFLIQNLRDKSSHLIISLEAASKPKSLEDLGFWGRSLENVESVLDSGKGIIVVDSQDQYSIRSFISSALSYLKQNKRVSSISFDSSKLDDTNIKDHDRIFTKANTSTRSLINRALDSNPSTVVFMDVVSKDTVLPAVEQSQAGKLVFLVTSEGSSAKSLQKVLNSSDLVSTLEELKLVVSLSPIQTIASSNGNHSLDSQIITRLEGFFGLDLPESWRSIYSHTGIKRPEELLHLEFPVASEYGGVTNLIEVLALSDYLRRTLARNPNLEATTLNHLATRSGMLTKREDGLIKSLRKEVDLADVIDVCK